ncbi:uncharacterized protein METZ01_LOCUS499857 [marine metagenome]|uniref:Uncharacterized protein n=1 Tax=marine metagenome TaxID=408172 RepID=A0A383DRX0_9ZZZZ|tara:strand:+ start:65 stop:451 length:387 start_codon:yes stop_codon:yes gene_type:complete
MKRKLLSILLILTQFSILSADTLTFNNGVTIEGKLVKYDEDRLIFKVDEESMNDIPNEAVIFIISDENQVVFNNSFVKNVTENNIIVANPAEERRDKSMKRLNTLVFVICVVPIIVLIIALTTMESVF